MRVRACAVWPVAAVAAALTAASAQAGTGDYVALRGIGGVSGVGGITTNESGTLLKNHVDDIVGGVALALGYDWSAKGLPFRTEIAYHHRFRFDYDLRIDNGVSANGYQDNLSTDALMVNLYYDFDLGPKWRPFVGFGLGGVRNTSDVERTALATGTKETRKDTSDSLAWTAQTGIVYRWREAWWLELSYRYSDLGTVEAGPFSNGTVIKAADYTSHDIIFGLQYRF